MQAGPTLRKILFPHPQMMSACLIFVFASVVHNCEAVYTRSYPKNGSYTVYTVDGRGYQVYCLYNNDRTGYTFPSRQSLQSQRLNLQSLRTDGGSIGNVSIYFWIKDAAGNWHNQSIVRPLESEGLNASMLVNTSWVAPIPGLDPAVTGPYVYASFDGNIDSGNLSMSIYHMTGMKTACLFSDNENMSKSAITLAL
jgi:hypothetical protein